MKSLESLEILWELNTPKVVNAEMDTERSSHKQNDSIRLMEHKDDRNRCPVHSISKYD